MDMNLTQYIKKRVRRGKGKMEEDSEIRVIMH
jgi:serine/threonine protein kinase